jgi:S-adenosylmethionine/arginine decarboxylase-like enzyme
MIKPFGYSLSLDVHNCNIYFLHKENIKVFMETICKKTKMERRSLYFELWDGIEKSLEGPSAVQFISTSAIVIHTLTNQKKLYLDFFSCKKFDSRIVKNWIKYFFKGDIVNEHFMERL